MVLCQVRPEPRSLREFVKSLVPLLLLAVDDPESEMQSGVLRVRAQGLPEAGFGFLEVLLAGFGYRGQQSGGNRSRDPGGLDISRADDFHQIFARSHSRELAEFLMRWQSGKAALLHQVGQPA